jgi:hypothetical protein
MSVENTCEYCQKSFNSKYNFSRHITTCKKNPNKQITNTYTEADMLRKEIELLEKQLKDKDQLIQSLNLIIQSQKSTPVQKLSHKNEEPDKAVEPKYKTAIEKYIHVDCKEAMTIKEFVEYTRENFTLDDFKSIIMLKYERKYITMIKKMLEKIPKKNMPIQIKSNKLNNEEGYIKTEDEFERYFRSELLDQFKYLIEKNGRNNLRSIVLELFEEYQQTNDFRELTETEVFFARMSILGYEDNDNDSNIDKTPKKILTLHRNMLDLFMVNI